MNTRAYKGCMRFPLTGAETREEFWQTSEYEGDFAIPARRKKILSKPRHYRLEVHLKQGDATDIIDLTPKGKVNSQTVAEILFHFARLMNSAEPNYGFKMMDKARMHAAEHFNMELY